MCTIAALLRALAERRPFRARAWHPLPCGPRRLRALPLEPFIKLLLPAAGILGELWLGHESYRCAGAASSGGQHSGGVFGGWD